MVHLITGPKGSGKTQQMIELANEKVKTAEGNVVLIKKSHRDTPVSYTHLDVYKRQPPLCVFSETPLRSPLLYTRKLPVPLHLPDSFPRHIYGSYPYKAHILSTSGMLPLISDCALR